MYIDIYNGNRPLGRFNLPQFVEGENGHVFLIGQAFKGGGNGVVFQSYLRNIDGTIMQHEVYAIKVSKQQEPSRMDRFRNEVRIISQLKHESIASYYDNGEIEVVLADGAPAIIPWVAMEIGNDNLQMHVQRHGHLALAMLIQVSSQMCAALQYFHSLGFIHRDIKPANFVWAKEFGCIKMIDFGIAKKLDEDVSGRPLDNFTKQQEFVGPVFFSSPELIAYAQDKAFTVDHRSDLFQLGKVIWYLATGKVSAGIPSKKDCPFIHDLVMNLLCDDPDDRIQTAQEVNNVLQAIKI